MDQKPPKRRPSRAKSADSAGKAASNGENGESGVPEPGPEGDMVQEVRQNALEDPRTAIAAALSAYLQPAQVDRLVDEVLAIHKRVPVKFDCPNCGHTRRDYVEIPDARAVVSALTDLLAQGFGRPGEAKLDSNNITFVRLTNLADFMEA